LIQFLLEVTCMQFISKIFKATNQNNELSESSS
jgi:hypothetical protein